MTKEQIEAVLDRVRGWPADKQEKALNLLLEIESADDEIYHLSPEEAADIQAGLDEVRRGEFASDEEMKALFDRYR